MKIHIIGISGVAGAGKDLLYSIVSKNANCARFSLADALKEECKDFCLENFGVDPTNCSREAKNKIRPFLVGYGLTKRNVTDGRYWIDKLTPKIKNFIFEQAINANGDAEELFIFVTDIRYSKYDKDEVYWLKKEMKGKLVHLSRFDAGPNSLSKTFIEAANEEEQNQNPLLIEQSDLNIEWQTAYGNKIEVEHSLKPAAIALLKDLKNIS